MGLFNKSEEHGSRSPTETTVEDATKHENTSHHHLRSSSAASGGFFRRRSSSISSTDPHKRHSSHFWMRHELEEIPETPEIIAAREKLARAEREEIAADRAVIRAAGAVAEARQDLKELQLEAVHR